MKTQATHQEIVFITNKYAKKSRDAYQVVLRLRKLIPSLHKQITQKYRRDNKANISSIMAYVDPHYLKSLNEYLTISHQGLEAKIQAETHKMLLQARQSNRAYHKIYKELQERSNITNPPTSKRISLKNRAK